ncbi:MAG: D-amino-acid transaminase [Balneolaceae bacterium]|nr:MAG: D-amino-acid transaminase [Balneolaceae bacterium]
MQVYLNGAYVNSEDAKVSVGDRGFVFGDGVYEVTRVVNGKFFRENEHLARLREGLAGLKIHVKDSVLEQIPEISRELIKRNHHTEGEAAVYLQVTRGSAWPRTHTFPDPPVKPTVYLSSSPFTPHTRLHQTGVDAITVSDIRWTRCNLKTVNLLPNTLAKQQAKDAGVNSAIMIRDGVVTESPNANIFGVKNGALYTFPATNYILNGITRQAVLEVAEDLEIPVYFNPIRLDELFDIDELFFSGTTTDIQPVTVIDGKPIGSSQPGPIVKSIQKGYNKLLYT